MQEIAQPFVKEIEATGASSQLSPASGGVKAAIANPAIRNSANSIFFFMVYVSPVTACLSLALPIDVSSQMVWNLSSVTFLI